uniref:Tyramine receptor ser-2-like n=1 Tax=Saccoglossus kowalevskii TaxID=10224 RepID=A0ABM0LY38_SACKO|nr:PREDICTED: tyramine receptor ser-2-like [Saccoglossus kowalevskii]
MVVCDLAITIFLIPFMIASAASQQWVFGDTVCQLVGYLNVVFVSVNIFTLTIVSFNRYFIIRFPFRYQRYFENKSGSIPIAMIWISCVVIAFPPLLGWGTYDFLIAKATCTIVCNLEETEEGYTMVLGVLTGALPICVFIWSYVNIACVAYRHSRKPIVLGSLGPGLRSVKITNNRDFKTTRTLFFIMFTFLLCWLPYYVIYNVHSFGGYVPRTVDTVATWLAFSTCALNPCIFGFSDRCTKRDAQQAQCEVRGDAQQAQCEVRGDTPQAQCEVHGDTPQAQCEVHGDTQAQCEVHGDTQQARREVDGDTQQAQCEVRGDTPQAQREVHGDTQAQCEVHGDTQVQCEVHRDTTSSM